MIQTLTRACVLLLALGLCTTARAEQLSAVVLMYHHFGVDQYPSTNIRLDQLEAQIAYLQQNDYKVLPLTEVITQLRKGEPLPDRSIAITIDDAYNSVYSTAYPRFKALGWPFTVFVSTDYIDKHYSNYMTWDEMREMQKGGASFGNHSTSHDHLVRRQAGETDEAWSERMRQDISHAQQRLHAELEQVVEVIAYPYGEYSLALAEIVAEQGLIGMGQHSGAIGPKSDFRFLPRYPMAEEFAGMEGFKSKIRSLAMPLQQTPQIDPVTDDPQPVLEVALTEPLRQLNCYASHQGRLEIEWVNETTFRTRAPGPIPAGRSRYNCTAPSDQAGRYYWFSQPWIKVE